MRQHKGLLKQVVHGSELGMIPSLQLPLIEIMGNKRILIENHCGVSEYGTNEICVRVKKGYVVISGQQLMLVQMSKEQIVICGCVDGIRLIER